MWALTAFWWAVKNWKLLALVAAVISIFTLGYKLRSAQDAYEQVETLQRRLGALQLVSKSDSIRAEKDAKRIQELEGLARETPRNDGPCLDRDAARRVRTIR
jgi:hypothetical protein